MSRATRGYTLIEVMMALVVLAIGAMGIYSLQNVAVHANELARDTTDGANVARWWMEQLRRDALLWDPVQASPGSLAGTQYLQRVPAAGVGDWFTPEMPVDARLGGGAAQQPIGREMQILPAGDPGGRFCTQMRFAWLRTNRVMRAEVRVWWYRRGGNRTLYRNCGAGQEGAMETDTTNLHWFYLTSAMEPPS